MDGAYCTRHRHRHRGGMSNKTPPPTELQIPSTVTTLTVNTFKSRLDKFWQHQDVIYDFKAEIHGTVTR